MKKILLVLVLVMFAAPVLADVTITLSHVQDTNEVTIGFTSDEANLVRAFGLDIKLDNDANIALVIGVPEDGYWVYPGTIQIDASGNVTDSGTIAGEYGDLPGGTLIGPPDGNGVTLECASLYAPVGPGSPNAPPQTGDLAKIYINGKDCQLCVTANVPRAGATGVVMENPDEVVTVVHGCIDVNLPEGGVTECMKNTAGEYAEWLQWGKPNCWCYSRQCRGDADGLKTGPFWVAIPDLNLFRSAFNKSDIVLQGVANGICCDNDHTKTGPFRVAIPDLNVFRLYFNKPELSVPECDKTDINEWCLPGQPCPPTP